MDWDKGILNYGNYIKDYKNRITNIESKQKLALKIASLVKDGDVIGFGSGSTSFIAICEIANKIKTEKIHITAIPTSHEIKFLCDYFEIPTCSLIEKKPDFCFDGADEVDSNYWLIKGRGGAMFKEKMNIVNSEVNYILVDETKFVDSLGKKYPIPVECYPTSIKFVKENLLKLGAREVNLRLAEKKDGPVITENGNLILDAKFDKINENLEKQIKQITGVIESGLFIGYNITILK